jgi:carboxyl-terminal processing protease
VKESGGAIRLTTALYYTPSGRSIQGTGITPDVVVEPARIEQVTQPQMQHEADLRGALKNTGSEGSGAAPSTAPAAKPPAGGNATPPSSNAAPTATPTTSAAPATPKADIPPGATPLPKPSDALDANNFGTDKDYQLVRAIDLLRGVTLFKSMAAAQ